MGVRDCPKCGTFLVKNSVLSVDKKHGGVRREARGYACPDCGGVFERLVMRDLVEEECLKT